ncbi:IQ motif and SEC7 domain-containing protein 1 isoform X2 [Macrosteles quadrilineatus]|uniref:IQ motif and SEC7 domain-containing protein 1 isoform X2 n=1 Tax=Macrosteles quadrilineatus TaxID=74068 RepID=UPI0023E12F74|nr:IQ motif and SEC7 domain-containing protein 1 isoform X2 [Macrosteles quadrilineatus]
MSGDIHHPTSNNVSDGLCETATEETLMIINQQCQQIEDLKNKLDTVMTERDLLLCEVSRLKFELEIADLKRIHDDRIGMAKERNAQTFVSCSINGTIAKEGEESRQDGVFPCHGWSQGLSKKGSIRSSSDIIKRSRIQNVYELSQDLLDKQIEMLERKYGGVKARHAALTIQRAFRRFTLLKKFAAITAMAKAEKRLSRRLVGFAEESNENHSHRLQLDGYLPPGPPSMPLRSMSMRERRNVPNVPSPTTLMPRSHSGHYCCDVPHPLYYAPQNIYMEMTKENDMRQGDVMVTSTSSPSSENSYHPMPQYPGNGNSHSRRVPPEVPKRTSSISLRSLDHPSPAALIKTSDSGSLSSVQSSGSDSSNVALMPPPSNLWTKKSQQPGSPDHQSQSNLVKDSAGSQGFPHEQHNFYKASEMVRKRQYRVGLNLFNKKPERGISYLVRQGFLENSPQSVARFLISRKGLSKQMIGEYLGNLQNSFNSEVLGYFAQELDLSGMQVDVALRKFQTYFRMPGEAQKIERLMEVFSHRYCHCNRDVVARLRNMDTIFVLAFAIIMLNTDLHTPNIKPERRMKLDDFIKNLRGIDDCCDIDRDMLVGIYERVKANEFKPGSDHVTQVLKVQSTIVGKKPNMALPHRRLVCYCRLYEVPDVNKKERPGVHQREVFLFNDLLVITKILSKKKSSVTYTFRQSFSLQGLVVTLFQVPYYAYGIKLSQRVDSHTLIIFNARNDHDRCKFAEDMRESISEMDEMESLRIEAELERQKSNRGGRSGGSGGVENRDSGVADVEVCPCIQSPVNNNPPDTKPISVELPHSSQLKRSALSNSLLDIHDQFVGEKATCQRRGSVGSLDSGMSVSFQSTSASTVSRDSSPHCKAGGPPKHQQSFLGGLFAKRERKASRAEEFARATQV